MNQRYLNFTVDDFVADEEFQRWVKSPDRMSDPAWLKWLAENPRQQAVVDEAAAFILNLQFNISLPESSTVQQSLERNLRHISQQEIVLSTRKPKRSRWPAIMAAAIIAVAALFTYRILDNRAPVMVEFVTGPGEIKTLQLPDSSTITMNENSSVSYSSSLPKSVKREVWMKGEVFFNVTHIENTPGHPRQFVVYSGDLQVEVLGTAFNVKSYRSVTNVSLNTGQIKIGVKDDPVSVTLQPGDFIQYSEADKKLVKRKVDAGLYSTWKEKKVKLDKMPMREIAQLIQDIYGYKVEITEPALRESQISGTLPVNDEKTFLEALAFVLDIQIVKQDSILKFTSKSKIKEE
ncbi:FecR family protein [Flavitalea antarctica]